jgi:hypothetical protein
MFTNFFGLRTPRYVESLLILCLCLTVFTACEQDDAVLPAEEQEEGFLTKRGDSSRDEASPAEMEGIINSAREFDAQLSSWREGANTRSTMSANEAADQVETLINLKIASGVNYKDGSYVQDSVDVSPGDSWSGRTIANVYESAKSILVSRTNELRGPNPGVRFVSVSRPTKAVDGTTRVYINAAIGSVVQTGPPQFVSSHFVWGGANTTPATCTLPAEVQIASSVNFELDACYTGNPTPPLGSCGFFSVVTIAVNPFGGLAGIPADFTYENRDWPSGATDAPLFTNEGEFAWHQDNDRDEICFNFNKMNQYVINQVDIIEGPMRTQARSLPGFLRNFRRPMGEFMLSEEFQLFNGNTLIVDFNAHYAFIDYGVRFFAIEPVFQLQSIREL